MTESSMEESVSQSDTLSGLPPWWMHAGAFLPHIHLTLLTQYKMWWSFLSHCWDLLIQHSYVVIYSHNHENVSPPLKSQVFGGHTTHQARSIMSLFYAAHFESAAAASYAISEGLIYRGAKDIQQPRMHMHAHPCSLAHTRHSTEPGDNVQ